MSTPTRQTIDYWLDWFGFLADDRLSPPQADEAKRVLELARVTPELLAALNQQLTQLQLLANLIDDETALATIELSAEMIAKALEKAQ